MTDTGQIPGEGLPENAGTVSRPGVPTPTTYEYLPETPAEDEDLLLPGAQSAWGNEVAPPAPEPVVETVHGGVGGVPESWAYGSDTQVDVRGTGVQVVGGEQVGVEGVGADGVGPVGVDAVGAEPLGGEAVGGHEPGPHETGGRDTGSVELGDVRRPAMSRPRRTAPTTPIPPITPRRPLHLGPPIPDASASPVRSLADRGPADAPRPTPPGPDHLDPQTSPQGAAPWGAAPQLAAPTQAVAETVAEASVQVVTEGGGVEAPAESAQAEVLVQPEVA
ncbi:MAG TPA: 5,6-dimethylbenzimidazole synthase, partial [Streptomyces sp.]